MTLKEKRRIDQLRHGIVPEGYKRTKVGICPEDWVENVLGDIYTERKEPGKEGLPLLMVSIHSGVSDGEVGEKDLPKRFKRIEDKSQYKRAVVGDLVFNMMRAWQGAIGSVRTEGMVSPAYVVAKPNDMVDPLFMDYYMKTNRMVHTHPSAVLRCDRFPSAIVLGVVCTDSVRSSTSQRAEENCRNPYHAGQGY